MRFLAFLALVLLALPAWGDPWTLGMSSTSITQNRDSAFSYSWTTVVQPDSRINISVCDLLGFTFDASTGNASTDAQQNLRLCQTETGDDCTTLNTPFAEFMGEIRVQVSKPYLDLRVSQPTTGGDTALVTVHCYWEATGAAIPVAGIWSPNVEFPTTDDSGLFSTQTSGSGVMVELCCSTDSGTVDVNFEERAAATPNTAGTPMLTTDLTCDSDGACSSVFTNLDYDAGDILALTISATSGSPSVVRVTAR